MAIPVNKTIKKVTYNGTEIPLSGGGGVQTESGQITAQNANVTINTSFVPDLITFWFPHEYYVVAGSEIYEPTFSIQADKLPLGGSESNPPSGTMVSIYVSVANDKSDYSGAYIYLYRNNSGLIDVWITPDYAGAVMGVPLYWTAYKL